MDILYISLKRWEDLRAICSKELLINVLTHYVENYTITISNKDHPSGLWCIDKFLKTPSVHRLNKVFVFVAFAYIGGFFKFEESKDVFGDMNLLKELRTRNCILEEEYEAFVHMIYEARKGIKPLKFNLLDEIENAPE